MFKPDESDAEYRCPGESYPISRAVHLARMAAFYPGCRVCGHRDDTGTLSVRQVKRLVETRPRAVRRPLFFDEGVAGVYLNDLGPTTARQLAMAMGTYLRRRQAETAEPPVVVIAGDGRPAAPELVAAVAEGLRWCGSHVVDIGEATAGVLAFAVDHLEANGGILVGNPHSQSHTIGLKFWTRGGEPLSAGGPLEAIQEIFRIGTDRPTRCYGSLRRLRIDSTYLAGPAEYYHGLRPLRLVLATTCRPMVGYLRKLTEPLACEILLCRTGHERIVEQIRGHQAHFAAEVDGDGESCQLWDEQGRRVPHDRLLLLLARELLAGQPDRAIVLEEGTPPAVAEQIGGMGAAVLSGGVRRGEMFRAMRSAEGLLGGGTSGRFWHSLGGTPAADALMTLTLLLHILSQSDRPVSQVLDAEAAAA